MKAGNASSITGPVDSELHRSRILKEYVAVDLNLYQSNTFHTKMMVKEIVLEEYLFNQDVSEIPAEKQQQIVEMLEKEMVEIFHGMNIY